MLAVELGFPGGRYHATPWGHHVNEGFVEWPPSPWRLLRALLAVRHRTAADEVDEEVLRALVERLAREVPRYRLPPVTGGHSRHYMPLFGDKTTKVFDTFLRVAPGEKAVVAWPELELGAEDRWALALLFDRLAYLGRAESWIEARLIDSPGELDVVPAGGDASTERGERVPVLAPMSPESYAAWRSRQVGLREAAALAAKRAKAEARGKAPDRVTLSGKERTRAISSLPGDLYAALHAETSDLHKQGWNQAPGSRRVDYVVPPKASAPSSRRRSTARLPTVARYVLASQAPPRLTEAVTVAGRVRAALLQKSGGATVFGGKDAAGPLAGHHHAFFLPEANGRHGQITHVTVYARMGFDAAAQRALERVTQLRRRDANHWQLVLVGVGRPADFGGKEFRSSQCPLLAKAREWVSRTPFVSTRHPKTSRGGEPKRDADGLWIGAAEHDLRRLLGGIEGLPPLVGVDEVADTDLGGKRVRWLEFRTARPRGGGRRGVSHGHGFTIELERPVRGPIAIGYGAHFGLGTFVPAGTYD